MGQAALLHRQRSLLPARTGLAVRGAWLAIVLVALVGAVVGAGMLARRNAAGQTFPAGSTTLGGLTATLHAAGWMSMDSHQMDNQGGYQMPAQMMPGAPAGDEMRLGVPLTLLNTTDEVRGFNLSEEFFLVGGRNDAPRRVHSDTFGQLPRLTPGSAVDGVLYFDTIVPGAGDPPLYVQWKRDGRAVRLGVSLGAATPGHGHG